MDSKRPRLSLDDLHLLRWLLGGLLMLLSVATVFYLDIGSEWLAAIAFAAILTALARPRLPARLPPALHRLAFPAVVAFFTVDIWHSGELLAATVRLDLLLLAYRGFSHRARRDDLQIIVLGLFLVVVAGVLTVSLLFALQILVFTACALSLLMVVTIVASTEGGQAPKLAPRGVVPSWAAHADWARLFRRLFAIADWRLLASASTLFVGVVAVSGLLFLAIPRFQLENGLFLERFIIKKAKTGFSDTVRFGDVTTIAQDDTVALDVTPSDTSQAPAVPYWRMVVLDEYGDGTFRLSKAMQRTLPKEQTGIGITGQVGARPGAPTWTFYLESGVSRYLPLLGQFNYIRFFEAQHFVYAPKLALAQLRDEPAAMIAYRVYGMAPDMAEFPDRDFEDRLNERLVSKGGLPPQLDVDVSPADREALRRMVAEIGPTNDRSGAFSARAIEWLRKRHRYSLSPVIPAGAGDPLVRWLESREPGHCELFAGALVVLARTAGLPARVVTGFKGGSWNAYSGNYTIRDSDAHAWAEVWEPSKASWLREDPLEAASSGSLDLSRGDAALARRADRSWSARLNSLRVFWYRRIVNFDLQSQADTLKALKEATDGSTQWLRSGADAFGSRLRAWIGRPWNAGRLGRVGGAIAAVVVAVFALASARLRFGSFVSSRRSNPVRREAGRWLGRVPGPESLVADLQRLRYGPVPTWPRPAEVFRQARRASARQRRSRGRPPAAGARNP